ncbi:hypothetical protein BH23ACT9_BH23ACT9_17070 [soil metagenome]
MDAAELRRLAEAQHAYLVAARRHLHEHPELSGEEQETAAFIASELRAGGIDAVERVGGGFGIVADMELGPGPTLAFVAHIDALPLHEDNDLPFRSKRPGVMRAEERPQEHSSA